MVTVKLGDEDYNRLRSGKSVEIIVASNDPDEKYRSITIEPPDFD